MGKVRAYLRVLRRPRYERPPRLVGLLARRPQIALGVSAYETALLASGRVDGRLKALAAIKAGSLVGCPFWLDIGSAVGRELGVTEHQLRELPRHRESDAFDDVERTVLDVAVEMSRAPVDLPDELQARLRRHFDETQLVELAAAIAWENYRGRFNRVFGVEPVGFSEGAVCAVAERTR